MNFTVRTVAALVLLSYPCWAQVTVHAARGQQPNRIKAQPLPPSERLSLGTAPTMDLGALDESVRDRPSPKRGVAHVGVSRPLTREQVALGRWQKTGDGGSVWRLDLQSQNAVGVRLHFTHFSVGGGQVWVHDTNTPTRQTFGPYTGQGRLGNGDFWTEVVFSSKIEVEYKPASNTASTGQPPFTISALGHLWRAGTIEARRANLTAAATVSNYSCFLDANCYVTNQVVNNAVRSSSFLVFGDSSGNFYTCSATLLNAPNSQPLLLTAGHCVNTDYGVTSLVAFFDYRSQQCGTTTINSQDPNSADPQGAYLSSLPQVNGMSLVAFSDLPFLDATVFNEVQNDLDFSLILLANFPVTPDMILSGYSTADVAVGDGVTSVSYPQGLYAQASFGTIDVPLPRYDAFTNAYNVDQTSKGRADFGSSGSGLYDSSGDLVGLLSTGPPDCANPDANGNCLSQDTACNSPAPVISQYTKFSAIYPRISQYLSGSLPSSNALPRDPSVFSATPETIAVSDGSGLGVTTLNVNVSDPSVASVQIRVGAPNGPLFSESGPFIQATTNKWVTDGMTFYLQNVTGGLPLTEENTIDVVTVHVVGLSFTATPNVIVSPDGLGTTTVNWVSSSSDSFAVHVNAPDGPLFDQGGPTGTATTGKWVSNGMTFYLVDLTTNQVAGQVTVQVGETSVTPTAGTIFYALPNPIVVPAGAFVGQTTLYWNVPTQTGVEIHIGAPDGPLFDADGSVSSATTGQWVTNGMVFYLQIGGAPLTTANTLATTTVTLTN